MKTPEGFQQCYNAQAGVDASSQVIVAQGVTNSATDRHQLVPLVEQIERETGQVPGEVSADTDYCWEGALEQLERRGIRGYIATGKGQHGRPSPRPRMKSPAGTAVHRMHQRLKRAR